MSCIRTQQICKLFYTDLWLLDVELICSKKYCNPWLAICDACTPALLLYRTYIKGQPLRAEDKEDKDYHDEFRQIYRTCARGSQACL